MFKFICFLTLAACACAASIGSSISGNTAGNRVEATKEKKEIIPVLKFQTDKRPDGSFSFMYEGGDQSFREESGVVENAGTDDEALEVSGSYRYIDADGNLVEVHYTAGKNGFVPVGTHILSEISALAKAAANLPNEDAEDLVKRRARSKIVTQENIPVKVVETKQVDEKKVEAKKAVVEDKKVENKKVEEKKVENKKVEEKKVEDKKVEEKKVEDKKVEEKKAGDKKVEEKKVEEKKVQDRKTEKSVEEKKNVKA